MVAGIDLSQVFGQQPGAGAVEPVYGKVGANIASIREQKGMTQRQLAQAAGIAPSSLAEIETGAARFLLGDLEKIANALQVPPRALLQGVWF